MLETVEIDPGDGVTAAVIWLHGLGADGYDFEPIVPYLGVADRVRFVFPHAPTRPVTVNGGMVMRAWYDIRSVDLPRLEDPDGVRDSEGAIRALIAREHQRGVPIERIVLAGFSQGGAVALHTGLRYPQRLAGIVALSCYLPLAQTLPAERHDANSACPVLLAHGVHDDVIPVALGRQTQAALEALDYRVEWHEYALGHEVSLDEIRAVGHWLQNAVA